MSDGDPIPDAAASALPPLLAAPPWTRPAPRAEPVVLADTAAPAAPAVESWPPGYRQAWSMTPEIALYALLPVPPGDTDWAEVAGRLRGGTADGRMYYWLVMRGPDELARELLADERYFDGWYEAAPDAPLMLIAARHGLAALPLLLHAAGRHGCATPLVPFLDAATARIMIEVLDDPGRADHARAWLQWHGRAAAPFVVPEALRAPDPRGSAPSGRSRSSCGSTAPNAPSRPHGSTGRGPPRRYARSPSTPSSGIPIRCPRSTRSSSGTRCRGCCCGTGRRRCRSPRPGTSSRCCGSPRSTTRTGAASRSSSTSTPARSPNSPGRST
ncbi:hypothetical protein [Actinomadura sp. CNU-125]|uniref:hypothetical protein n=1 Tax=Actinomadura sp. CNU-125 TaxID=1904961 RepID=UPI001177A79D|nr:hypothetical protein [Actinomadura sp. CNU-125]